MNTWISCAKCWPARRRSPATASLPPALQRPRFLGHGQTDQVDHPPLRADLPIFIGAEGPRNVAQTAQIADGWLPLYYSPYRQEVYADQLVGARQGLRLALTLVNVNEDLAQALYPVKAMLGFYVGGMGSSKRNFHAGTDGAHAGIRGRGRGRFSACFSRASDRQSLRCRTSSADEISCAVPDRIRERIRPGRIHR